jgi:CBS domain-containing protein
MTLLIFNNGTHADPPSDAEQIKPKQHALKKLDLSLPSSSLKHSEPFTKEREQSAFRQTPVIASPIQTLSYTSTQKVADSLENRRRLSAAHIMSFPVITAMPHQLVLKAKLLMAESDISHIIIVNKEQ